MYEITVRHRKFANKMSCRDHVLASRGFCFRAAFAAIGCVAGLLLPFGATGAAAAQETHPAAPAGQAVAPAHAAVIGRTTPVGFPQDAGPHDADAVIEWWYFNTFLTTAGGHHYAVIGSFFRTGITPTHKGHYLIYALIDLDAHQQTAYSILDRAELGLLKLYLGLQISRDSSDPKPLAMLGILQREELPAPHRIAGQNAIVKSNPLFSINMENNVLYQTSPDARSWKVNLNGDDWTLDLTFKQPDRPAMLPGGKGKTGLHSPEDMYYLSLTRMKVEGTLTQGGIVDSVTGPGWIDRQWGTSWAAGNNGWDWFGLQLDDGSDLIVYRVRDNATGKVLRSDATLLTKDGVQELDTAPVLSIGGPTGAVLPGTSTAATALLPAPAGGAMVGSKSTLWTDPRSNIAFPQTWSLTMPKIDLNLTTTSAFPEQVMPVLGMGDAIWEGVVNVTGTHAGKPVTGHGFMELVGYKPSAPASGADSPTGAEKP